jgi:hypothetical protein
VFCGIERERGDVVRICGITDEATSGVGIKTDHEEESEMMSVPESLEALVANFMMSGSVDEKHYKEHEVPSDTAGLGVMDVKGCFRANL